MHNIAISHLSSFPCSILLYHYLSPVLSHGIQEMESDKVGTLKGYDVVLSISEKAINTGLRALYNHPIATDGGFHPVTPITGGLSPPPSKFAINHDWRIVCNTWEDEDTGEIHLDETTGI